MKIPRKLLLPLCVALVAVAYYLVLFTEAGNYYHGGTPLKAVTLDAAVVLAAFACWEVFRSEKITPVRAVAAAVGVPLALVAAFTLCYGLWRYVAV